MPSGPPLSLQTLVENAVKFGAANRRAGGEIRYEAGRRDGRLVLRVFNPGSCCAPSGSTRQGLVNLRRRLDVLYGREAGLELRQGEPDLVIAELFVPFETSAR
jgi:LytS/YehU family sensor histidine kinase